MEKNYSDILCQAIEIVSSSIVDGISFDRTIECTIVDDSSKAKGKYIVSDGSTKFEVYSTVTTYRDGNVVYVTIPNNNFNNQKFITGKKVSDTSEPFIFTTPFDTILDLTNNLVLGSTFGGLVANGEIESVELFNLTDLNYRGFTRFGIQASFKSWLKELKVVNGNYGIKLTITDKSENVDAEWIEAEHYLLLDSSDMYGNPYDFDSFFQQEKLFDISDFGIITKIKCEFYQAKDSFILSNGIPISLIDDYGNETMPNLFVKDVYICAGYDLRDLTDEYIHIYTFDTSTYVATQTVAGNLKQLHARWVHFDENKNPVVISAESNLDYEVRWYRYRLGAPRADEYSGVYWDRITTNEKSFQENLNPDTTKAKEMVKIIILYNNIPYRSNIITFQNEKEVINQPTIDAMQALSINCEDGTYGNYLIYDEGNSLIDAAQGKQTRTLTAYFQSDDYTDGERIPLTEATSITWTFPTVNSMFILDELPVDYAEDTYSITKYGDAQNGYTIDATQTYRIKNYYSAQYLNNTVQVSIVKDGITYVNQKDFSFGQAGTTGTDTTLIIDFDDNTTAVTIGDNQAVTLTARLYDYENNEVDLKTYGSGLTWEWSWYVQGTGLAILTNPTNPNKIELNYSSLVSINNLYIIQVKVKGWGDYDLIAFLPIPLRTDKKYRFIAGANQVIYLSDGTPLYYKKEYHMYDDTGLPHAWSVYPSASSNISVAELKNNILVPPKFYIKNNTPYGIKCDEVWMQPVLVIQNRYPSAVVNEWDGKTITFDDESGTILSTMIAAGSKNASNEFSGVIMGDCIGDSSLSTGTGLYGFNNGAMSFAFKDDGTAFIGKSGKGRILFDGDKGVIESDLWSSQTQGMHIDLDDGIIKFANADKYINIDSTQIDYPFQIGINNSPNLKIDWEGKMIANSAKLIAAQIDTATMWDLTLLGYLTGDTGDFNTLSAGSLQVPKATIKEISTDFIYLGSSPSIKYQEYIYNTTTKVWSPGSVTSYAPGTVPRNTATNIYMPVDSIQGSNFLIKMGTGNDGRKDTVIVEMNAPSNSIALYSGVNILLSATGSNLIRGNLTHLGSGKIDFTAVPKDQQFGIYARFA